MRVPHPVTPSHRPVHPAYPRMSGDAARSTGDRVLFTRPVAERYGGLDRLTTPCSPRRLRRGRRGIVRAPAQQDPAQPIRAGTVEELAPMPMRTLVVAISTVACLT